MPPVAGRFGPRREAATRNRILFLLFLSSGFCGLVYQVVWLRLAFASFGITTPVLSVVVSVFMLGLGGGAWAAGRWVDAWRRRTRTSAVLLYALTELAIGTGAFVVPRLFRAGAAWMLPLGEMDSAAYLAVSGTLVALAILPWCVLMGATLPLMMGFVREVDAGENRSFSFLYFANVLGAALGTLLSAFVLIETLGFAATLMVAGATNVLVAAAAFGLARAHPRPRVDPPPTASDAASPAPTGDAQWSGAILFVTGMCSMAYEVIWTRSFTPVLKTYVYSFASLLAVYLVATFAGSWAYRRGLRRGRVLGTGPLLGWLAVTSLLPLLAGDPRANVGKFGVLASIAPFCAALGYLTPQLVDARSVGSPAAAGRAYAINVAGCIVGPLVASYALLPWIGARLSLLVFAVPFVALALTYPAGAPRSAFRRLPAFGALALGVACAAFVDNYEEALEFKDRVIRRDHTATVVSYGTKMSKHLLVNGTGMTVMDRCTKVMAHLPLAVHGRARRALVICFGMGTTFRALRSWDVDATAVELVPSVRDAFPYYFDDAARILANDKSHVVIDDGRRFLARAGAQFDVVTLDPPPPVEAAGSSLLYSKEFYDLVKLRLAPGGILQQWYPGNPIADPTENAVVRSLLESFPHVRMFESTKSLAWHALASMSPIEIPDADALLARMPEAARRDLVEWNPPQEADPRTCLANILAREFDPGSRLGVEPSIRVTDDRPYNEYYKLRRWLGRQ